MYSKLYLDTREEEEAHASFLVSAAQYASSISSRPLKSHLNILSNETLRMKNFARGRRYRKNETCQYCLTHWKNGDFSFKVLPVSKKQKRMKKIYRNIAKNKPLVKIEKKLAEARNIKNMLLVKCLICTKEVRFKLCGTYTGLGVGKMKTSVPVLSLKNMEKKMKKQMRIEMKMKENKSSNSHGGVSLDRVSGFPSKEASGGNANQTKSPAVGHNSSQNEDDDGDEIKITYERRSSDKKRKLDCTELDQGKPAKKSKKKKKSRKSARYGVGVLDTPSSMPYNTPGSATYNTPYSAECVTPYDMQYNTPYGIPYSVEYGTTYNNGTYATPYNTPYNASYGEMYANYGDYSAVGYNSLGTGTNALKKRRKRKKKKKGAPKNQNSRNSNPERDLVLNPFSDKVKEICDMPKKKKKLNRWKKLISEEESKSTTKVSSFKDFLDKLKRG